ncbi:MAG: hypothetical protein GY773_02140 [Actinomycetia bacterium]|nr:hypothetical protein [Actinomycetes bacterium]
MPNGRLIRIDHDRGCAYLTRGGRSYEASLSEVESAARVPGARVRYKLRRSDGEERAEQVVLRRGTRTNKRQRRFGDLSGARRPGTKVKTAPQRAYGIDVATQPFRVVRGWLTAMGAHDLDAAAGLYLPGAAVHLDDETISGHAAIRAFLEHSPWLGIDPDGVDVRGFDRFIQVEASESSALVCYFIVEDGHLIEQWHGPEPLVEPEPESNQIEVISKSSVAPLMNSYAREKLGSVIGAIGSGTRFAQMKLSETANPNRPPVFQAEANIDIGGTIVRAHASGSTMTEVIDEVIDRLRNKLEHRRDRERHKATGLDPTDGTWRHGFLPTEHPPYFERPVGEREVVRHKSFAPDEVTVEEAAWDLSLLDYDFYLFVELSTGADCLLEQSADSELIVHSLTAATDGPALPPGTQRSTTIPPTLRLSEAIALLDESGQRFVFFRNTLTERGNVVYRRVDGHYGLITPPAEEAEPE